LEKLFVAFGSTEVSNKMASYKTIRKHFLSKRFTHLVLVLLWRQNIAENFSVRVAPSREAIYWIEET
jgi:hypothetical protein